MSPNPTRLRRRLGHGGLSLLVAATGSTLLWAASASTAAAGPATPPACADGTCVATFASTGAVQTFVVPAGVTTLTATVSGASGGASTTVTPPAGAGGRTGGTFAVQPGEQLDLVVGGAGLVSEDPFAGAAGGYGGGGSGGFDDEGMPGSTGGNGGGGGSFVFGDAGLLLAAGGGGAASDDQAGGAGGGAGADATAGTDGTFGSGGQPGTLDASGAGGNPFGGAGSGDATSATALPLGGQGGFSEDWGPDDGGQPGGGGGGGYHAGGGGGGLPPIFLPGSSGSGGGGGAGFAADGVTSVSGDAGVQVGDGQIILTYSDAQQITFTSAAPDAVVGSTDYTVAATGTGTAAVTFTIDDATTNGACTIAGTVVSFVHAGTCAIAADQAADADQGAGHAVQSFTVGKASQAITFDPLAETGHVGDVLPLQATGGASSSPLVYGLGPATTPDACVVDGSSVTLTGSGTCDVTVTQAGDADYLAAPTASHQITVDKVATTTVVSFDEPTPVYGQPVTVTAKVTGATAGSVQFSVDGDVLGDPVDLDADGTAGIALPTTLEAVGHPVKAVFTPDDAVTYAGSTNELTLPVAKASTATKVTVRSDAASVVVTATAPGSGTPEGTVTFTVGGTGAGTVTLDHGRATLGQAVPADQEVSVTYNGDVDFAGSSDSTLRTNPTITAAVSSASEKSPFGWYRSPVTVTFTCTPGSAPLDDDGCPSPVTLSDDGASQNVTRTVTAEDGGVATTSVTGINLDSTKPEVTALGIADGDRFFATAPPAGCLATDDLSGVYGCAGFRDTKGKAMTYEASAIDQAGNQADVVVHATIYVRGITDAPYVDGAYEVHAGQAVTLVAKSSKQARVMAPTLAPKKPTKNGAKFTKTGDGTWALGYTIPASLKVGKTYNLGIRTSSKFTVKIHVIA